MGITPFRGDPRTAKILSELIFCDIKDQKLKAMHQNLHNISFSVTTIGRLAR
jgi:hypothetical protein